MYPEKKKKNGEANTHGKRERERETDRQTDRQTWWCGTLKSF